MLPPSAPPPPLPTKSEPRPRVPEAPHAAAPIESPQSPPARSWNQNESTVVLDLRRNPDSAVKLNGPGSRPANWSTELENCLKEKQKKQPIKRPVLKRGELEGLRERVQHPRGCELTTWVSLPYRVTRCRLRLFESGSGHGRKRPTLRQPLEGDLRSSHRPRLDLQDARSRTKDWWEDRSTFRSLARVKLTANEEREVTSRAIDPDCRHLVVWGGELSLTKSDSRTSSIEILVK